MQKPTLHLVIHNQGDRGDVYSIARAIQTVDYSPGQVLTKQQVQQIIDRGDLKVVTMPSRARHF